MRPLLPAPGPGGLNVRGASAANSRAQSDEDIALLSDSPGCQDSLLQSLGPSDHLLTL